MSQKRHKKDTKRFAEMTFAEQARSFNALMTYVKRAVHRHMKTSKDPATTKAKCIKQLQDTIARI